MLIWKCPLLCLRQMQYLFTLFTLLHYLLCSSLFLLPLCVCTCCVLWVHLVYANKICLYSIHWYWPLYFPFQNVSTGMQVCYREKAESWKGEREMPKASWHKDMPSSTHECAILYKNASHLCKSVCFPSPEDAMEGEKVMRRKKRNKLLFSNV